MNNREVRRERKWHLAEGSGNMAGTVGREKHCHVGE